MKILKWKQFEEKSCSKAKGFKNDIGEELPPSKTKRTNNTSTDDESIEVVDKTGKKTNVPAEKKVKENKIASFGEFLYESEEEPKSEVQADVREEEKKMKPKVYNKYQLFFKEKLKKYGVTGIGALGDKRSQFFKEIKTDWAKKKAQVQAEVQAQEED